MTQASPGDTVKVHYTGKLEDGSVFDSSEGREPLEFTIGENHVIPGFENSVVGMQVGDTKTAAISVDEAYGPHRDDMVMQVGREQLPEDLNPQIGDPLQVRLQNGQSIPVKVVAVDDAGVTLDANHPLAGQPLVFSIELVEIA